VDLDKYSLKKVDVLFNNTNSKELVGRAALVQEDLNCGFSNHITRLRVKENLVFPQWLTLVLNYLWSKEYFLKHCRKWIGQAGINTSMLKSIKIPVPPLEEQRRIVARIEELLSRVEEAKRLRKQAREETEKIMQAALHKVFSRAEEKGWEWKKLGDVCEIFSGSAAPQEKKYFENGRYPFVRVQDLGRYGKTMNLVSIKDFVNDLAVEDLKLVKAPRGSILFPKSGAAILTNSRAILGVDAFIVSHLAAIKAPNPVTSRFIFFWLCEVDMRDYLENPSYPSLKLSRIKQIPIPFPSIEEQKRIVSCLERLFNKVEEVKKLQQQSEKEIEKMAPVILDQAFSGKL
jgi:type I restriction enzyme S subunit